MAQKAVRSEASSPNSLGPERDWPEVRGEECRPRTVLSWLLAKWVVGESEEAGRRTLSSHGPENPEEKEIALSLRRNKTKQKILLPALHRGKERRCSRRLLRKSKLQHLRVARVRAASSTSWTTWGLAGTRGAPLSCERLNAPAYVSIRPGAERLWRTQEGAHGDGQTEAWPRGQRWMVHHAGAGCAGLPRSAAVPPRNCWTKPSTVSPNSPPWEMGASRKLALSTSFISARLSQRWRSWTTMVDIAFPRDRAVTFVARRAKSVTMRSSCINPGSVLPLVHLFERLGLVNLQDSHGVQGGGCLARSTVSFGRESGCQLTGLGRETWTVPPSGGVSWAQVHRDRSLHLGNARVPPGHSAIEGSEDGGAGRAASGRERGHPRTRQLLMHLREERHRGRARLWAAPRSEKPIVQPRGLGTGRSVDLQPDAHGCPGKHVRQLWVRCGGGDNTRGGKPHRTLHPQRTWTHPPMLRSTSYLQMAHRMKLLGAPWDRPAKSPGNRTGCSLRED